MIKNKSGQVIHFSLFDSTGTAITTGTVNPYVTVDGGTQAAGAGGAPTHEGNGQWSYTPTADETNGASIGFLFTHTSAVPVNIQVYTVAAAVEDAISEASASNAPLSAHMSKLQAVNQMLRSIGEQAVSALDGTQIDATMAESILDETSRRIQSQGWHANTRYSVSYTPNASDQFVVPTNVLRVDTVNPDSGRRIGAPNPSSFYNVQLRRASDDSKWLLYDLDNDTETWANGPSTLTVDIVEYLRFNTLPTYLQVYIYKAAAHEFQKSSVASQVLYEFTLEDVQDAMIQAVQADAEAADRNIFTHHRPAYAAVYRNNPLY